MADNGSENEAHVDFSTGDADVSASCQRQCFVSLKDIPCKIVEMSKPSTGKSGHTAGKDIFRGKKCDNIGPSTHSMNVPNISPKEYILLDVSDDGFVSLLDEDTNTTREDMKLPTNDIGNQIKEKFNSDETIKVTVVKYMGEEHIVSYKLENY